jgi:hypothetical protein
MENKIYFYNLIVLGVMEHKKEEYATWYLIRTECWDIIIEVGKLCENPQKRIEENQKIVDDSLASDLNLVIGLSNLIMLDKLDKTFMCGCDDAMGCIFGNKLIGTMKWTCYIELKKQNNRDVEQAVIVHYLVFIAEKEAMRDAYMYVIEFDMILSELSKKVDILEAEMLNEYEPPVQKVNEVEIYEVLKWLILLYKEMVKLDPCIMFSRCNDELVKKLDEGTMKRTKDDSILKLYNWNKAYIMDSGSKLRHRKEAVDAIREVEAKLIEK